MKAFIIAALAAVGMADNAPYRAYPAPAAYAPAPAPVYPDVPPAYNFNYGVLDAAENVDFTASENREGYITSGSYKVALPDGRIQTVTYKVEGDGGYTADVSYEGEAQYPPEPAPKPVYPAPKPVYAKPTYN